MRLEVCGYRSSELKTFAEEVIDLWATKVAFAESLHAKQKVWKCNPWTSKWKTRVIETLEKGPLEIVSFGS